MSKYVDAMLIINNQRLNEIYPDLNVINAFGKADDTLTTAARSIAELITWEDVHIRLDFNDVDTTLRNGGAAIISTGYGEGENRVTKAIQDALNSPLLKNRDVLSSKKLLFNIYINPDMDFKMEETDELTSFISSIDTDVDIIWGMYYDRTLENRVKMTILATGFEITINDTKDNTRSTFFGGKKDKIDFGENKNSADATERIRQEYGDKAVAGMVEQKTKSQVYRPHTLADGRRPLYRGFREESDPQPQRQHRQRNPRDRPQGLQSRLGGRRSAVAQQRLTAIVGPRTHVLTARHVKPHNPILMAGRLYLIPVPCQKPRPTACFPATTPA